MFHFLSFVPPFFVCDTHRVSWYPSTCRLRPRPPVCPRTSAADSTHPTSTATATRRLLAAALAALPLSGPSALGLETLFSTEASASELFCRVKVCVLSSGGELLVSLAWSVSRAGPFTVRGGQRRQRTRRHARWPGHFAPSPSCFSTCCAAWAAAVCLSVLTGKVWLIQKRNNLLGIS